ncbi:MAG: isoprenoid biosynthesis glyoxalase ElbB [Firmicutes bacterium]|nr:isoprenoid biosynthesis glyoxalase ElbB [Bacillota bacterium]
MIKTGLILSGCGYLDGSEIHEAVFSLYFLDKYGAEAICMAPDMNLNVMNHITNKPVPETRNVLIESARIARGKIRNIKDVKASELDAVILPGGFGAAKNLCDFAAKGPQAAPHPEVARLLREMHRLKKPIGAICISPALIACVFKEEPVKPLLTIGTDKQTAEALRKMNARHESHSVREIAVDRENKIVSTPAYMLGERISEVGDGIEKLIREVLSLVRQSAEALR